MWSMQNNLNAAIHSSQIFEYSEFPIHWLYWFCSVTFRKGQNKVINDCFREYLTNCGSYSFQMY